MQWRLAVGPVLEHPPIGAPMRNDHGFRSPQGMGRRGPATGRPARGQDPRRNWWPIGEYRVPARKRDGDAIAPQACSNCDRAQLSSVRLEVATALSEQGTVAGS